MRCIMNWKNSLHVNKQDLRLSLLFNCGSILAERFEQTHLINILKCTSTLKIKVGNDLLRERFSSELFAEIRAWFNRAKTVHTCTKLV